MTVTRRPATARTAAIASRTSNPRPTAAELAAASTRTLEDVVAPGLRVLFCGINPGLYSSATGHHFARPGNRFWKVLHLAGFTPRQLIPAEQALLLQHGIGVTNVVARTTASAAELNDDEIRAGGERLSAKVAALEPRFLAVLGVTVYRIAFGAPRAPVGEQPERRGRTRVWVLPNPSGLNAHYQLPALVDAFAALRHAVEGEDRERETTRAR